MKQLEEMMDSAVNELEMARQQAESEVKDESLDAIAEYFGGNAGVEKVMETFGVEWKSLSIDDANGILCILKEGENRWREAPCGDEGPTEEQEDALDDIVMEVACDIICYLKKENIPTKKYYFIVMVVNGQRRYVLTENDIEIGGFVDAEPEDFGLTTMEEAEAVMEELKRYANEKGYAGIEFYIEKP